MIFVLVISYFQKHLTDVLKVLYQQSVIFHFAFSYFRSHFHNLLKVLDFLIVIFQFACSYFKSHFHNLLKILDFLNVEYPHFVCAYILWLQSRNFCSIEKLPELWIMTWVPVLILYLLEFNCIAYCQFYSPDNSFSGDLNHYNWENIFLKW